jgi:DNA mismatch repair protein MutS
VKEGAASQSYGLQVAQLAGVPKGVIAQARRKLQSLERDSKEVQDTAKRQTGKTLSLALEVPIPATEPVTDEKAEKIKAALLAINPDDLTPRQAHEALYKLRGLL